MVEVEKLAKEEGFRKCNLIILFVTADDQMLEFYCNFDASLNQQLQLDIVPGSDHNLTAEDLQNFTLKRLWKFN